MYLLSLSEPQPAKLSVNATEAAIGVVFYYSIRHVNLLERLLAISIT